MIAHYGVEGEIMVLEMADFTTEAERCDAVARRDEEADGASIIPCGRRACIAGLRARRGRRGAKMWLST